MPLLPEFDGRSPPGSRGGEGAGEIAPTHYFETLSKMTILFGFTPVAIPLR